MSLFLFSVISDGNKAIYAKATYIQHVIYPNVEEEMRLWR